MFTGITIPPDVDLNGALWQFSGRFWARPCAQSACLALQAQGWSVTRILCALWLASEGQLFSGAETEEVTQWRRQVTEPLRQARKKIMKNNPSTDLVRDCIARSELEAEKVELAMAQTALPLDLSPAGPSERVTVTKLVLDNLMAAAPERTMDNETGSLLNILADELSMLVAGDPATCS